MCDDNGCQPNPPVGNRLLTGKEALLLQGFPTSWHDELDNSLSDSQKFDLAGNAFSATVIMSLLIGLYRYLPAHQLPADNGTDGIGDLLSGLD